MSVPVRHACVSPPPPLHYNAFQSRFFGSENKEIDVPYDGVVCSQSSISPSIAIFWTNLW